MSFVSLDYSDSTANRDNYMLVDDEFGELEVKDWATVVDAYIDRKLPVGRNLALATIYFTTRSVANAASADSSALSIEEFVEWQNEECISCIPNWEQHARERDEYLAKLIPLL